jgi:hypothetical protein
MLITYWGSLKDMRTPPTQHTKMVECEFETTISFVSLEGERCFNFHGITNWLLSLKIWVHWSFDLGQ